MHWHSSLKVSVGGSYIFKAKKKDLGCPALRKWLYLPAPQTVMTPFLIQEEITGKINSSASLGPKPFTASIWLICVLCDAQTLGTFAYTRKRLITSVAFLFPPHIFFSEAASANGSAGNSQEREDHEYYNEIPGKEPPTGGMLDMRMKAQTDQRANCLIQCKKQCCLVSTSSSGITISCLSWEWIIKRYCDVKHGIKIRTRSWLSWERVF